MNIKRLLFTIVLSFFLASNLALAKSKGKGKRDRDSSPVPEITAENGTSALALLGGVLLLAGERYRLRRNTSK